MKMKFTLLAASTALALTGCVVPGDTWIATQEDKTVDTGFDGKGDLSGLKAGIWVDPHGCDHWIIDDGVEGYLSARLDDNGKPVCSGVSVPNTATGDFRTF